VPGPAAVFLPDDRLHLQYGPIDLIVEAFGAVDQVRQSYRQARDRFQTILDELVSELALLRSPWRSPGLGLTGVVAQRMENAVAPLAQGFLTGDQLITPMAAVAGAVADEILQALTRDCDLQRAYVNNGGDIAIHLAPGEVFDVGMASVEQRPHGWGKVRVDSAMAVAGVATSGRGGRSFSLGIADSVTVLAKTTAAADAAATLIGNAIDLPGDSAVIRRPANQLDPDSDLGERLVTIGVGPLAHEQVERALEPGLTLAKSLQQQGHIVAAALCLAGEVRICGDVCNPAALNVTG